MRMGQFSSLAPVLCQSWESRYELGIVCLQEDPERYGIIEKVFPCKLKFKSVLFLTMFVLQLIPIMNVRR